MKFYLAQVNIAKMKAAIDHPVMAEFVANLDYINSVAENSEGFIWRLKDESNNATSIKIYDDDFMIVNMSVWESAETLSRYVYHSDHVEIYKKRKAWFDQMKEMHMALWYTPEGVMPTVSDAIIRLDYLRLHGSTPFAFTFKKSFTEEQSVLFTEQMTGSE
jgi:hypothetical protein